MSDTKQQFKQAIAYLRVADAAVAIDSKLAQQRRACHTIANRLNAEIVEEYVEFGSSAANKRPTLERMLDNLDRTSVDYLLVNDLAALTRNFHYMARILERLRATNTELVTSASLTPNDSHLLAKIIREKRQELGLSANALARQAGVTPSTITRIETAQIHNPRADSLMAIARVLGISITDLLASAAWLPADELPAFKPYLRAKYGSDLPPEAVEQLEASFARLAKRHGYDPSGPAPGEDET